MLQPLAVLAPLAAEGLVQMEGSRVTVTEAGQPVLRSVCAAFDRHLDPTETRHAKAI